MTRPVEDPPGRLLESDATDFERRVLEAALQQKPSKASTARMAAALGVSATAIGTATSAKALAAGAAASKGTAAVGASVLWPWVSAGVALLVVGGVVVGTRSGRPAPEHHHAAPPAVTAPKDPVPPTQLTTPPPAPPGTPAPSPTAGATAAAPRARAVTAAGDLGDQVALIDSARAAVSAGAGARALEILRRYQDRYPAGSFRPEAAAIKIEALMKIGRESEARALAQRFVAEHRGSLLARRVAEVAGLAQP